MMSLLLHLRQANCRLRMINNFFATVILGAAMSCVVLCNKSELCPTFNAHDVLPDLLGEEGVGHQLDKVVDGVDAGVDGLEPLYLLADGQGVGHVGAHVALVVGHLEAPPSLCCGIRALLSQIITFACNSQDMAPRHCLVLDAGSAREVSNG